MPMEFPHSPAPPVWCSSMHTGALHALCLLTAMDHARAGRDGGTFNGRGLQVAVRCSAFSFHRHNTSPGSVRVGSGFTEGNFLSIKQRSDLCHPKRTVSEQFLLQVFSGTQRGGGVQNRAIFALSWIYVFFRYLRKYRFRMLTHASLL